MNKTKKWFTSLGVALTLILFGCSTLPLQTSGDIPPQITEWSERNVWKLVKEDGAHGTAFFINSRQLITACHVVDDVTSGVVTNNRETLVIAFKVASCDKEKDVAILYRDFLYPESFYTKPTLIAWSLPREGGQVYGSGYPLWFPLTTNRGYFGGEVVTPWGSTRLLNSVPTIMGDSGSPLLSLRDGKVYIEGIRVSIAGLQGFFDNQYMPHMALASSGKYILEELRELNKVRGY